MARFYDVGESGIWKSEMKAGFDHWAAVLAFAFSAGAPWAHSDGLDTSVRE